MNGMKYLLFVLLFVIILFAGCFSDNSPDSSDSPGSSNAPDSDNAPNSSDAPGSDNATDNALGNFGMGDNMLDGPGMEREWTVYDLYNDWVEIKNNSDIKPYRLVITSDTCTLYFDYQEEASFKYTISEGKRSNGKPAKEIYLKLEDCRQFEKLIYHEEIMEDGRRIPIISATTIELDGRGEIVIMEFSLEENLKMLPDEFMSSTYRSMNDRVIPPTYIK